MKQWLQKQLATANHTRFLSGAIIALLVLLASGFGVWKWYDQPSQVTVTGVGDKITFATKQKDIAAALAEQGIHLGAKDLVTPTLTTKLRPRSALAVEITRAIPVVLTVEGKRSEVVTQSRTVGDLLKEFGVTLGEKDKLSVDVTAPVAANMEVKLTRRTEEVRTTELEIPFDTIKREDGNLTLGETKEVQAGEAGVLERVEVVYLEDGQVVGSEVKEETVIKEPVERIVAYGTTGVVYRGGRNYRYTQELQMSATGYTAGKESNPNGTGHTYTGMRAVRGVVAVDPNVIPLYTRLYIEGYGPAVAADIGGAIKGNKIDLCFDTLDEALTWGRRPVTVYILGD